MTKKKITKLHFNSLVSAPVCFLHKKIPQVLNLRYFSERGSFKSKLLKIAKMAAAVGFEPTDIRVKAVRLNHLTMPLYQDAINKPYRNIFTI